MARLPVIDPARSFDATSLTGSYQNLGTVLESTCVGFIIYNTSDVDVQVSFDGGTTNGPIIPANGSLDSSRFNQMRNLEDGSFIIQNGAQVQVKQVSAAGTTGDIYFNVARL